VIFGVVGQGVGSANVPGGLVAVGIISERPAIAGRCHSVFVVWIVGIGANPGLIGQVARVGAVAVALVVIAHAELGDATFWGVGIGRAFGQAVEVIIGEALLLVAILAVQDGDDVAHRPVGIGQVHYRVEGCAAIDE